MELRTYTRIHAVFPTYCTEFAKEIQQKAFLSCDWSWWPGMMDVLLTEHFYHGPGN